MRLPSEIVSPVVCAALRQRTPYRSKAEWTAARPLSAHVAHLLARLAECEARGLPPYGAAIGRIRERLLAVAELEVELSAGALVRLMIDASQRSPERALDQVGRETAAWVAAELCEWWQGTVLLASPAAGISRPARCALPQVRDHLGEILAAADALGPRWQDLPLLVRGLEVALLPEDLGDDGGWGDGLHAPATSRRNRIDDDEWQRRLRRAR